MRAYFLSFGLIVVCLGVAATDARAQEDPEKTKKTDWTLAHMRLHGQVNETADEFDLLLGSTDTSTTRDWMDRLDRAAEDEGIDAIALEIDGASMSASAALELAEAIRRIDKNKPVYTYIAEGGIPQYLLASAGRWVAMEPAGGLAIVGLGIEMGFYKGTMDKWGVIPQFVQAGKFKGAAEPYMQTAPSEQMHQQMNALLDGLYGQLCRSIAEHRGLTENQVKQAIDEGPLHAKAARKHRFVDALVTRQSWFGELAKQHPDLQPQVIDDYGRKEPEELSSNPLVLLRQIMSPPSAPGVSDPTIAIITAEGVIMPGPSGTSLLGARVAGQRTLIKAFQEARDEENIKAVVFRINSPGGSAMASEMIYQAVRDCALDKPVVVSITGMGASGGYYIAMGGQIVFADPMAIVGSIGVVGGRISLEGLLKDQHMHTHAWTRGRNAGLNLSRPWTAEEIRLVRREINRIYRQFTDRVSDSRGTKIQDIERVAQGRIFTADQARKQGLVDAIGGMRQALAEAKKRAGLQAEPDILMLPRPKTLMDLLRGDGDVKSSLAGRTGLSAGLKSLIQQTPMTAGQRARIGYLLQTAGILNRERLMAAMPFHLDLRY